MVIFCGILLIAVALKRLMGLSVNRSLPLAFCVAVATSSILVTTLSLFHALTPRIIRILIIISYGSIAFWLWRRRDGVSPPSIEQSSRWTTLQRLLALTIISLLIPIAALATLYPPSNWDSMTYHLSRVAMWIQNRSVFPYHTNNFRQVQLTPGAEYLILIEQLFWFSDTFANWIQLSAFIALGIGTYGWCTHWGISRVSSLLLILTTFSAPMIVLQAQTTQNDLAAAVPVFLLFVLVVDRLICRPKEALIRPLSHIEVIAIPLSLAVGHLIKPTATLISLPLVAIFTIPALATLLKDRMRVGQLIGVSLLSGAAGLPEVIIRKATFGSISISSQHVRTDLHNLGEQSFNGVRHLADHFPNWIMTPILTRVARFFGTAPNIIVDTGQIFSANEDLTGNPTQALFYITILLLLVIDRSRRALLVTTISVSSWFLLHAIVNNQPWMSRLQTPWFVMMVAASAFAAFLRPQLTQGILWFTAIMGAYDASVVLRAEFAERKIYYTEALPFDRQLRYHGYFLRRTSAEIPFSRLKRIISLCDTVGYISGEDDFDYPIAWLTIRNGRRFEHRAHTPHVGDKCTLLAQP